MRSAIWAEGSITLRDGLEIERPDGELAVAVGSSDPYGPVGALAVDPAGERAWVQAADGRATRVDLRSGAVETFDFVLRDAVYDPSGCIVAVVGADRERPSLVEFDDAAPTDHRGLTLPEPRRIHWPFGQPYRFAVYELDGSGDLRLSANRHGVALAQVGGLLWARFADGHQGAWRMPPVYQGWTCAYPHEHGLVVTSLHNGRTGDFVWLDRHGVWVDAFDSQWKAVAPCVPTRRGFVAVVDDELLRFEGFPARITERVMIGGWPEEVAVDHELNRVVAQFRDRRAVLEAAGTAVSVSLKHDENVETLQRVAEPLDTPRWRFEAVDDPDLGRIWRPDAARVKELAARLRERHAVDPHAAVRECHEGLGRPVISVEDAPEGYERQLWGALQRWVSPPPSRSTLVRVVERIADGPDDPFLAQALESALPESWQGDVPTRPVSEWVRHRIPGLHGGFLGEQPVRAAEITAETSARPPWSIGVTLSGGETARVSLERFDPSMLRAEPSEVDDETAMVRGVLVRDGAPEQPVLVEIDPWPGYLAYRVTATPAKGGEPLLRTGAELRPVVVREDDEVRRLAYASETWPRLYRGRCDGRRCISPFADELDGAERVPRPAPLPAIGPWIEALVADERLELARPADDALRWAIEAAIGNAGSVEAAAKAVEDLLLTHEAVEELYADSEELGRRVAPLWPEIAH